MARYVPGTVPTSDLANTQRWLREEFSAVGQSVGELYEFIAELRGAASLAAGKDIELEALAAKLERAEREIELQSDSADNWEEEAVTAKSKLAALQEVEDES